METAFFDQPADTVARGLIGATLFVDGVGGRIVETEAYDALDPASHSFRGPTVRNAPMFGPPGRAYVYRIYGLHWCFNIVCDGADRGSAVLIRALEPTRGLERMRTRRMSETPRLLCAGPGRLCQALGIDGGLSGAPVSGLPFALALPSIPVSVVQGRRIGLRVGVEARRRYAAAGSRFLSRPMETASA